MSIHLLIPYADAFDHHDRVLRCENHDCGVSSLRVTVYQHSICDLFRCPGCGQVMRSAETATYIREMQRGMNGAAHCN